MGPAPILQCCGSGSAWIRIKLKGRIRIRIKVMSWSRIRVKVISWIRIPIRINLQMTSQNEWKMSLFEHIFKISSLFWKLGSRHGSASCALNSYGSECDLKENCLFLLNIIFNTKGKICMGGIATFCSI
jgi:hypothetical protein